MKTPADITFQQRFSEAKERLRNLEIARRVLIEHKYKTFAALVLTAPIAKAKAELENVLINY